MYMNLQVKKMIDIFEERGFISIDNFNDYKNIKSIVNFKCDKGHVCSTKARYILYDNVGCKTCQYDNKLRILNSELSITGRKMCNYCEKEKNKSEFGILKRSHDGLRGTCKECRRRIDMSIDDSTKIKRKESSYKYYANNPYRVLVSRSRSSMKKKGFLEFDIDAEYLEELYIKQDGKCYWSGIDMCNKSVGLGNLDTISIDRLNCDVGYIKENIVLVCKFINLGRGNSDMGYFRDFLIENFKVNKNLK